MIPGRSRCSDRCATVQAYPRRSEWNMVELFLAVRSPLGTARFARSVEIEIEPFQDELERGVGYVAFLLAENLRAA